MNSLNNLIEYDKTICLEILEKATNEELWHVFLEGQAELFFEPEFQWIANQIWWNEAKNILEIGFGNGAYLAKLSDRFEQKLFYGIEKLPQSVNQANKCYARDKIAFHEGNAEVFNEQLCNSANVILFRLTLQHLNEPLLALQNAWQYLDSNGYVLIIDSCDLAKKTSHPITAIDKALKVVAESQISHGKGNRKITCEIVKILENKESPLSEFYEIIFNEFNLTGNVKYEHCLVEGPKSRKLYFNHNLLFLTLLHRTYQISVDLSKGYDELNDYLKNENAWTALGTHHLVLKKISRSQ